MKIVSWNLLYRNGAALTDVSRLIESECPDLLLMQEATEFLDALTTNVGGHFFRSPVIPGRNYGLAAWSREAPSSIPRNLPLQTGLVFDRSCQIIQMPEITVANVHLSHGQVLNRRQLSRIYRALPHRAAVIGDCNLVGPALLPRFRDVGPRGGTLDLEGVSFLRLDRCLVRGVSCERAEILKSGPSDHRPIAVWLTPNPAALPARNTGIGTYAA
jgi:endonuclease/exonuclease/phosphatase (EEP) superfamily protein YafD